MNTKVQLWCVWSIPVFVITYMIGMILMAGFVPPPAPSMTPAEVAHMFAINRNGILGGQILCLASATLYLLWTAVMSVQMARIEGRFPVLAVLQFGGALLLVAFFYMCSMLWIAAAYRPDLDPALLRMFNDFSWLIFVMVYPEYVVQLAAIAIVGFMDTRSQPLLPRWACFATLWVAVGGVGGGFASFFTGGPFAWNGIIGFWVPIVLYLLWLLGVMLPNLLRAVKQSAEE